MNILFETERLIVRHYTKDDAGNFFRINGDERVVRYIRAPKNKEQADVFLQEVIDYSIKNPLYGRMAVDDKVTGEFIGSFAIIPVEKTEFMQLGYSLLPENWGRGYATELTVAGLKYIFERTPLERVYAYTEAPNIASQKVLLKAGFKEIARKKEADKELVEFLVVNSE